MPATLDDAIVALENATAATTALTGAVNVKKAVLDDAVALVSSNANLIAVGNDLNGADTIGTVAGGIANVAAVAGAVTDIGIVSGIASGISAVAGISAAVTAVGSVSSSVTAVALIAPSVSTVGSIAATVATVAAVAPEIATLGPIAGSITAAAGNATNINAVAANATNINSVAGNGTNISAVAGAVTAITTVAGNLTNINAVAANNANISTVAGIGAAVSTVSGISAAVSTVSGISANVTTVAGIAANVTTVATNIGSITAAAGLLAANATTVISASVVDALSNGVIGNGAITGGSGGTNGTFLGSLTGGGGSGAAFEFVVSGNALTSIIWLAKGRGYTSAPTLVFTASSGLTGASATAIIGPNSVDGQSVNVLMGDGLGFNTYTNVAGTLALQSQTLSNGGVALGQKIALLSAPGAVTPLPAGYIVALDPVMAAITDDRYVPTSMGATVTHNAYPGGTEMFTTANGATLTKNYATDSGLAVHRIQMSAHNQLFSLTPNIPAGLIKGKFLVKSTPGAGNQNITAGLYSSFMDTYAITEGAWTTVSFSRTTSGTTTVNIWNSADSFPLDVIFREDIQVYYDGEAIPATEPSRIGAAVRRTAMTRAAALTRGSGNSVVAPFIGRIPLSTRDDNGVTFNEATFHVAVREDTAGAVASGCLFTPIYAAGGVTGYNTNAVVLGTQGGALDIRARDFYLPSTVRSIAGKGWFILSARLGPNGRSLHLDGIPLAEDTTPHTPFTSPYLCWGGAGYLDTQPLVGRDGKPVVYPFAQSDDLLNQAVVSIKGAHVLLGDAFPARIFFGQEGDSIAVATGLPGATDGFAYLLRDDLGLKPLWRMSAQSGSTLNTTGTTKMMDRLPSVLRQIRAAVAMGHRPILFFMIGANGIPSSTDLLNYLTQTRNAVAPGVGAKVVLMTPTYRTGGTFNNAQLDTWNAYLRTLQPAGLIDGLVDLYTSTYFSSQTFATDAPGGVAKTIDGLHWSTATHAAAYVLIKPIIQSLLI